VQDAEPVVELVACLQFGGDALGRYLGDLDAKKFGKGRLIMGALVH
jgi:hypothetical protein